MAVALKGNALISAVELEMFLQVTIASSDYKNTLINIASDFIENFANRVFISATYTREAYDGNGATMLYLDKYPITALTAVESWDTTADTLLSTFTLNEDYFAYNTEGSIYKRGGWYNGRKNYRITYTAGYLIDDVPYDLKNACAQLAGLAYSRKGNTGIASESIGAYSVSYDKNPLNIMFMGIPVPAEIAAVLISYRRPNV